jgi:hypothetical protein
MRISSVGQQTLNDRFGSQRETGKQIIGGQFDPGAILSGNYRERQGQLAGLNLAGIGYGQGLEQTGQDIASIRERLKAKSAGSDPISEAIRNQKSGAVAGAQRSLAGAGVKGGAAAGAVEAIDRQRSQDVAASLYGQQRQSLMDERSLASNTLAGTVGLMQGEKAANVKMPNAPDTSGMFGTVICTELHRQGLMPTKTYLKDSAYGKTLPVEVIAGYQFWAIPVVNLMKKSPTFTKMIAPFAMSWAKHIAGEKKSIFGYMCQITGEPVCGLIGSIMKTRKQYV